MPARPSHWLLALLAAVAAAALPATAHADGARLILREAAPASAAAEAAVARRGGSVGRPLRSVGGFAATVPGGAVAALRRDPAIAAAWPDARVELHDDPDLAIYDQLPADLSWPDAIRLREARRLASGRGVTVAVLDTGVTRHPDLGDRVAARVDLTPDADGYDRYGHGSSMAGLVAGDGRASQGRHAGVAPGSRVVAVKVATFNGATDVSAVIGALEWIAAHDRRLGIRVVSLSLGTTSSQSYVSDPLDFAVERLWADGLVVVAAAGNRGDGGSKIDKPGDDPRVITVGAAVTNGTASPADDSVAPFSSRGPTGDGLPKPDLVAPGINLVSHAAPGSTFAGFRPAARVGDLYFKSTGTSPATAVVAGVAALMLERNPALTPDALKAALTATANRTLATRDGGGGGLVDAAAAVAAAPAARGRPAADPPAQGLGSIDAARGDHKPYAAWKQAGKPEEVSGEVDVLGNAWDPSAFTGRPWTPATWPSSPWAPLTAEAAGWAPAPAPPRAWGGMAHDESSWFKRYWHELGWDAGTWRRYWHEALWD